MLIHYRWSPFIKSFKDRSVLAGAVIGQQAVVAKLLIQEYEYTFEMPSDIVNMKNPWLKLAVPMSSNVFGKDDDDNNVLHHTFINDMPDVR